MSLLVPPRRYDPTVPEIMDRPGNDLTLLREDLVVLEKINRWLGGQRIALLYLKQWLERNLLLRSVVDSPTRPLTILDLATGATDIPRTIAHWA